MRLLLYQAESRVLLPAIAEIIRAWKASVNRCYTAGGLPTEGREGAPTQCSAESNSLSSVWQRLPPV